MDQSTTGLILRTRPFTETSLIVQWLTEDWGRLSTIARGARRPKSPFSGKVDLFYEADFSFLENRRGELHLLREVSLRDDHHELRQDLGALQGASYFVQALEQTTEANTPLPGFYHLFREALQALGRSPRRTLAVLTFETKLLAELGLHPGAASSPMAEEIRALLGNLAVVEWRDLDELAVGAEQVKGIDRVLQRCFLEHVGRLGKARALAVGSARD